MIRFVLVLAALATGALAGGSACRYPVLHRVAGKLFHRGELVALAGDCGVFRVDLEHARAVWEYRHGDDGAKISDRALLDDLTAPIALQKRSRRAPSVEREFVALRGQFADRFPAVLAKDGLSQNALRRMLADTIAGADEIDQEISSRIRVSDRDLEDFYRTHTAEFVVPLQLRVRHIFFAAPTGYPPEVFAEKKAAVVRAQADLEHGKDFAQVAAALSEDEATKGLGGDLGLMSQRRIPPEFFDAVSKLPLNATPAVVPSHLGFSLAQVTEIVPTRREALADAAPEIRAQREAERRRAAVAEFKIRLAMQGRLFIR